MSEFVETAFSPTAMPATVLLLVVALYWFVAVVGGLGLDFLDLDLDFDTDFDADTSFDTVMSVGAVSLRFLNIGQLPINIWVSIFAIAFWLLAMMWRSPEELLDGFTLTTPEDIDAKVVQLSAAAAISETAAINIADLR